MRIQSQYRGYSPGRLVFRRTDHKILGQQIINAVDKYF